MLYTRRLTFTAYTPSELSYKQAFLWNALLRNFDVGLAFGISKPGANTSRNERTNERRYLGERVKFTGDAADAPIPHFAQIKASLVDPPHHPQHLSFDSWKKVYR